MTIPRRRFFQLPWRSRRAIEMDVDDELQFDVDMRTSDLVRDGLAPDEARRRAVAEFGDLEQTRRYCVALDDDAQRAEGRTEWRAEVEQDLRFGWRGMRRSPGFVLVVLCTLAIGIGANTAVFSVVRKGLLDQLPYQDPDRVVALAGVDPAMPRARRLVTAGDVADMQHSPAFNAVAAYGYYGGETFVGSEGADVWGSVQVGGDVFRVLGTRPLLGRTIDARDAEPGAAPVVLLTYSLWQRAFGGDSAVVGRAVQLSGASRTVVGVMPPDFLFPERSPEIFVPLDVTRLLRNPSAARQSHILHAVGRLGTGVTVAQANAELTRLARAELREHPEVHDVVPVKAVLIHEAIVGDVRPILLAVMAASALVLLLACVNVSSLFLSRAAERRRELAVRAALGAGRMRLVRQLLVESAMIALAAGALGVALAAASERVLAQIAGGLLPTMAGVRIDAGVLAFASLLSIGSIIAFGLLPALSATRLDLRGALSESGRGSPGGRSIAGRLLVTTQMALAVLLLIGAGLLGRTLLSLQRTGVGFDTGADVVTFRVNLSRDKYPSPVEQAAFWNNFLVSVRARPTVQAAGLVIVSPWNGYTRAGPDSLHLEERSSVSPSLNQASRVVASDGYFAALDIPILRGRAFSATDRAGAPAVGVINEGMARQLWGNASAIGRRIRVGSVAEPWLEVIGVAGDVRPSPAAEAEPTVYVPMAQSSGISGGDLVVRASANSIALVPAIRRDLRQIDPAIPLVGARTMADVFGQMLAAPRVPAYFIGAFALLALVLAVLGVYSVMAYAVIARRREFGIRAALGAGRSRVLALVMRQGMTMAVTGTIVGAGVAFMSARVLSSLLVGVTTHDVVAFTVMPLLLLCVSAVACLVPARRAVKADPVEVLRDI